MSLFRDIYVRIPAKEEERVAKGVSPVIAREWQYAEEDKAFIEAADQELLEFMYEFNRFLKRCGVKDPSDFLRIEDVCEIRTRAQTKRAKKTESTFDLRTIIPYLRRRH